MNNMTIFAQALADNRNYKNAKIDGNSVGVANSRAWQAAVKAIRIPAYAIAVYRHDNMANPELAGDCDYSKLYAALCPVVDMIGVVNGAKLSAKNCAESIIAISTRTRSIATSEEYAHALNMRTVSRKALNNAVGDEAITVAQATYDKWVDECKRLEELPGNCKKVIEIQTESAFVKAVELLLGDAVTKQNMKSAEQVAAEEEAKRQARRAATKAKKAAKKAAAKAEAEAEARAAVESLGGTAHAITDAVC